MIFLASSHSDLNEDYVEEENCIVTWQFFLPLWEISLHERDLHDAHNNATEEMKRMKRGSFLSESKSSVCNGNMVFH